MMGKTTRGKKFALNKGREYMAEIGRKGGKNSPGGFGRIPGQARRAGRIGGLRRKYNLLKLKINNGTATDFEYKQFRSLTKQLRRVK